ncbi:hypothetical protein DO72_4484 [Burkholderia pseudomallei]|nr:hypothetical protein DO72_4484 [Burkholderia pseudomallei]
MPQAHLTDFLFFAVTRIYLVTRTLVCAVCQALTKASPICQKLQTRWSILSLATKGRPVRLPGY